ncbi:MAG: Ldh family oxidoreductase [Anaerolineae bacterium]|nr:Ldh family oxidoreductase [Anaerolineae bacterium]
MAIVQAEALKALVVRMFDAVDVDAAIGRRCADHLVDANLAGVDSHGVMRVPDYIKMIQEGRVARTDKIEVVREFAATAVWDGHFTIGQYTANKAAEKAMEKAATYGIGMLSVRHSAHIGRLGEYAAQMANKGYVGFITASLQGAGQRVAPYGGRKGRLGTNPLAWGVPTDGLPMVLDVSTSYSAEGKVRVKMRRGETLTPNWLLNAEGYQTLNPADLYTKPPGALLTTGGHKGYGLSLVAETLSGILNAGGHATASRDVEALENGFAVIAMHIDAFGDLAQFKRDASDMMAYMKVTPPLDGVNEVLVPGEPEVRERERRLANGIPIEDDSWNMILASAQGLGVDTRQ